MTDLATIPASLNYVHPSNSGQEQTLAQSFSTRFEDEPLVSVGGHL